MQNTTTPTISALESIDDNFLAFVSGGCGGKKRGCCPAPVQQCQIVQLPPAQPPAPLPQAPMGPPPPSGDSVSTSVSINGVPQS